MELQITGQEAVAMFTTVYNVKPANLSIRSIQRRALNQTCNGGEVRQ